VGVLVSLLSGGRDGLGLELCGSWNLAIRDGPPVDISQDTTASGLRSR